MGDGNGGTEMAGIVDASGRSNVGASEREGETSMNIGELFL